MKRVFLAIPLPDDVKSALEAVSGAMQKEMRRAIVTWVKPAGFHITLHFLGDQTDEAIAQIGEVAARVTGEYRKTTYRLSGLNFFPDVLRPRIVVVDARETNGRTLESLQAELGRGLEQIGKDVDHRPWHPHITLGRIKSPISVARIQNLPVPSVQFVVDRVQLIQSHLSPEGAMYNVICEYLLPA